MTGPPPQGGGPKKPPRTRNLPMPVISLDSVQPMGPSPNWDALKQTHKAASAAAAAAAAAPNKTTDAPSMPLMTSETTLLPFSLDENDPLLQKAFARQAENDGKVSPTKAAGVNHPTIHVSQREQKAASQVTIAQAQKQSQLSTANVFTTGLKEPPSNAHQGNQVFTVIAPKGKLGVMLFSEDDGSDTYVRRLTETSVMSGKILPGDRIIAVNDKDVSHLHSDALTKVFSTLKDQEKKLTVSRSGKGQPPRPNLSTAHTPVVAQTAREDQVESLTRKDPPKANEPRVYPVHHNTSETVQVSNETEQADTRVSQTVAMGTLRHPPRDPQELVLSVTKDRTTVRNAASIAPQDNSTVSSIPAAESSEECNRVAVIVSPGRIGVVLDFDESRKETLIDIVDPKGPSKGRFHKGDKIVEVNGIDVRGMSLEQVAVLIKEKSHMERHFVVQRTLQHRAGVNSASRSRSPKAAAVEPSRKNPVITQRTREKPVTESIGQFEDAVEDAVPVDEGDRIEKPPRIEDQDITVEAANKAPSTETDCLNQKTLTNKAEHDAYRESHRRNLTEVSSNTAEQDDAGSGQATSTSLNPAKDPEVTVALAFPEALVETELPAATATPHENNNENVEPNTVVVTVNPGSLGITLRRGKNQKETFVKSVDPEGPSAGKFQQGDIVLEVDGCDVRGMSMKKIIAMLKKSIVEKQVTVRRNLEGQAQSVVGKPSCPQQSRQSPPTQGAEVSQAEKGLPVTENCDRLEDALETSIDRNAADNASELDSRITEKIGRVEEIEGGLVDRENIDVNEDATMTEDGAHNATEAESAMDFATECDQYPSGTEAIGQTQVSGDAEETIHLSQPNEGEIDQMAADEMEGTLDYPEQPQLRQGNVDAKRKGAPSLLESPRTQTTDDPDLKDFFERGEKRMVEAEENWLLDKIDRSIISAEEEQLLARTERYIIAAEQAPMPASIGSKVSCLSTPEEIDADTGPLPDEEMLAQWSELPSKPTEEASPESISDREPGARVTPLDDECVAVVEVTKMLPKYVENSNQRMFSHDTMQKEIVEWISKQEWAKHRDPKFLLALNNSPFDDRSVSLYIRGRADVVETVKDRILKVIRIKLRRFNLNSLLFDEKSLELDLQWNRHSQPQIIGIPAADERGKKRHEGLWLATRKGCNEDLSKIIGYGNLSRGAAIVKVNDVPCATMQKFNETLRKSTGRSQSAVKLTVCVSRHADLKEVDQSLVWPGYTSRLRGTSSKPSDRKRKSPDISSGDMPHPAVRRKSLPAKDVSSCDRTDYLDFVKKLEEVKDFEFKNSGIGGQFVNSRLWNRHKELGYGTTCNENCACTLDLTRLAETVVSDYILSQKKKDRNWRPPPHLRNGEPPEGFVSNFASKFIPRLEEEYPKDTPTQTLQRLTKMWPLHKKTRNFGLKCRNNCRCGEGWAVVFKKGNLTKSGSDKGIRSQPKARPLAGTLQRSLSLDTSSVGRSCSPQTTGVPRRSSLDTTVPRNNSLSPPTSAAATAQPRGTSTDVFSMRRSTSPKTATGRFSGRPQHDSSRPANVQQKEYFVTYDARAPLGFYCLTEKKGNLENCKIVSVNPHLTNRDRRLCDGTIVRSAAIVEGTVAGDPQTINSSWDLSRFYESAKKRQAKLRIAFINSDVKASATSQPPNKDWKMSGAWQGKKMNGWAGGASILQAKTPVAAPKKRTAGGARSPPPFSQPEKEATQSTRRPSGAIFDGPQTSAFAPGMTLESSRNPPLSSKAKPPGPSLLREPRKASPKETSTRVEPGMSLRNLAGLGPKKRVKFMAKFEYRLYRKGSRSCDFSLHPEDGATEAVSSPASSKTTESSTDLKDIPRPGELDNAIRNKGCKEVIQLLYAGAPKNEQEAGKFLIKKLMDRNARLSTATELDLKLKAIRIFVQAESTIGRARSMKKAMRYELELMKIENLQLTQRGREHGAAPLLSCCLSVSNGVQELVQKPPMPLIGLSETVDWGMIEKRPKYCVSHNANLKESTENGKEVIVTIEKGDSSEPRGTARLGRFIIPVSKIAEALRDGGNTVEANVIGSEYLSSGTVVVRVRRKQTDAAYLNQKKKQIANEIAKAVDWMEQFNKEELVQAKSIGMSGNLAIADQGKFSLLHAAVSVADLGLVKRLMDLGADPTAKAEGGSAIYLASNLEGANDSSSILKDIISVLKCKNGSQSDSDLDISDSENDEDMDGSSDVKTGDSTLQQAGISKGTDLTSNVEPSKPVQGICRDRTPWLHPSNSTSDKKPAPLTSVAASMAADLPVEAIDQTFSVLKARDTSYVSSNTRSDKAPENGSTEPPNCTPCNDTAAMAKAMAAALCEQARDQQEVALEGESTSVPRGNDNEGRKAAPPREQDDDLPILYNQDWMVEQSMRRCTWFNRPAGCKFGKRCHHRHVRPPVGSLLDNEKKLSEYGMKLESSGIRKERGLVPFGRSWVTAAYHDPNDESIYYAERGPSSRQSSQGIYWYPTEVDALHALERVVAAWRYGLVRPGLAGERRTSENSADRHCRKDWQERPSLEGEFVNPASSKRERAQSAGLQYSEQHVQKRARLHYEDNRRVEAPHITRRDVFQMLIEDPNLSSVHAQITGVPLRKDSWTCWNRQGYSTAIFTVQNGKLPGTYQSISFDGHCMSDKWWHKDERTAKASAFLGFLEEAARKGFVAQDLCHTKEGKTLKFCERKLTRSFPPGEPPQQSLL